MTDITVIGLGAMGSTLAQAFLGAGHSTTVWNRTQNKMAPLVDLGANTAESVSEGLRASPITVVCVDNYDVSIELIIEEKAEDHLAGRVLIQLSTGTPKEAIDFGRRILGCDGMYLDGAIMAFPEGIGTEDAQFLLAGADDTYKRCKPILSCLGGDIRYLGSEVATPAVIDLAVLTQELATYIGAIHGANLCESENIGVDKFASVLPDGHLAKVLVQTIHSNSFDTPEASMAVWGGVSNRIGAQARDAGISSEIPDFLSTLCKRGISAGLGGEDLAALIKVLKQ